MNETPLKQPKKPVPGTVAAQVLQTVERLNLDEPRAAEYFEALAPALHGSFLPPVTTIPPRKRGRVKNLAPEIGHVEKSGLHESTDSIDNSVMSKNPV